MFKRGDIIRNKMSGSLAVYLSEWIGTSGYKLFPPHSLIWRIYLSSYPPHYALLRRPTNWATHNIEKVDLSKEFTDRTSALEAASVKAVNEFVLSCDI